MRAWYDVFDANYEVDALPALSTCAKSFEDIAVRSFQLCHCRCDCRWYIYIYFYMMMVTSNLQCSIMDQRSHGNKQLFDETYFHLWIGHLFCFPLYMYIMCTVRLNKTVQARFMNKCWRHDFSLHLINLYGKFFFFGKKKYYIKSSSLWYLIYIIFV